MALTTFTLGQVLTAAQLNAVQANDYNQTVSTKTASYTLVAADKGTRVVMNVATANTVTVNTSLFSAGDTLVIQNIGAGVTTVTAGTATVSSAGPLAIPTNGSGTLYFTSAGVSIFYPSAGPAASSGLTLISKTTVASTTQQIFANCFSASYDFYSVKFSNFVALDQINMRYGTSGTPDTASTYSNNTIYNDSATVSSSNSRFNDSSSWLLIYNYAGGSHINLDIQNPFLAQNTNYQATANGLNTGSAVVSNYFNGVKGTSTSYTDLVILSAQNFSGTISIYGYANS
jgi:hypothetical protein